MMNFSKNEILKTILIVWLIGTTVYVAYDLYAGYKTRGMKAAYDNGYAAAASDIIKKTKESGCQAFQIQKDTENVQIVNGQCLQQAEASQQTPIDTQKK